MTGEMVSASNKGFQWSSLWGHETCEGSAGRDPSHHVNAATGAFGGAPHGATERVRGVPKMTIVTM